MVEDKLDSIIFSYKIWNTYAEITENLKTFNDYSLSTF